MHRLLWRLQPARAIPNLPPFSRSYVKYYLATSQNVSDSSAFSPVLPGARLGIQGTHFTYNGQRVFLSGINKAWEHYAHDFGNGQYNGVKARYEHVFQQLQNAGANSIREIHYNFYFHLSLEFYSF